MTVTASRLGSSPLTVDWTQFAAVPPRGKASPLTIDPEPALQKLRARFDASEVGFYFAPIRNELSQAAESQSLAESLLAQNKFTDCLFLGIGGSALGPISLLSALQEKCTSGMRFHFCENPDSLEWTATLKKINPESTLVCVAAKSGTTFETISQMLLALEWLGKPRWKSHVIAITDPAKGDLREFATQQGLRTLTIVPSIGGRFSIFSPVGLFAAALAGLNLKQFLLGAQQVHEYLERVALEKNPLIQLGSLFIRHFEGRPIHVCMPYSNRLRLIGDWFVQLWGESLGKDGKGFTPIAAVGATDQHSILQLLRDGPDDKITTFITVDQLDAQVKIPKAPLSTTGGAFASFSLLEGHTLHDLLMTEYRAISLVLTRRSRPHLTIQLDRLDERAIGALTYFYSALTALTGTLWGVDPFDQPGVEEGKIYIRDSLNNAKRERNVDVDENSPVARLRRNRD